MFPPCIVANTTGSTAFSAVNSSCSACSNDSAKAIAENSSCVIIDDSPDGCGAMLRYKHATAEAFESHANIFYDEYGSCIAHKVHNISSTLLGEGGIVGHVHAAIYITNMPGRPR